MELLLDTHALLWWLDGDERMPMRARRAVGDAANVVYVSAASAWELSTKLRIGKLPGAREVVEQLPAILEAQTFTPLPIQVEHGRLAGLLPGPHRDPFDRMLAAQAQLEGLLVVSSDTAFDGFGVRREWD